MPFRRLMVTPEFAAWAQKQSTEKPPRRLLSPRGELEEIAAQFVSGAKVVSFIRRIDPPKGERILRLTTTSFRLAGWCPAEQTLVLAVGASADDTHGGVVRLSDMGKAVVAMRRALGLPSIKGEFHDLFKAQD
jgi:hypothetical protein